MEVRCIGEEVGLDRECMDFVTACFFLLFSFFFWGERVGAGLPEHSVFLNNIFNYIPDASKQNSLTVYVAGWCPFYLWECFFGGICQVLLLYIIFLLFFSYLPLNILVRCSLFLVIWILTRFYFVFGDYLPFLYMYYSSLIYLLDLLFFKGNFFRCLKL